MPEHGLDMEHGNPGFCQNRRREVADGVEPEFPYSCFFAKSGHKMDSIFINLVPGCWKNQVSSNKITMSNKSTIQIASKRDRIALHRPIHALARKEPNRFLSKVHILPS